MREYLIPVGQRLELLFHMRRRWSGARPRAAADRIKVPLASKSTA